MVAVAGAPSGDIRVLPFDEPFESLVHSGAWQSFNTFRIDSHRRSPSRFRRSLERGEWFNKDFQQLVRRS
jgi:hypothetical protein